MLKYITKDNKNWTSGNIKSQPGERNNFLLKSKDSFAKRKIGIWATKNLELHYFQRKNESPTKQAFLFEITTVTIL